MAFNLCFEDKNNTSSIYWALAGAASTLDLLGRPINNKGRQPSKGGARGNQADPEASEDQRQPVFVLIRPAFSSGSTAVLVPDRHLGQKPGHWALQPGNYPQTCGTTDT
jgi:hypothetical protein